MAVDLISTPIGFFQVHSDDGVIVQAEFVTSGTETVSALADKLRAYFSGELINLPCHLIGSPFQRRVWRELLKIPYGQTRTYKQIAELIGRPTAYRAVANACGANQIPVIIPCHRVTSSSGLGGFSCGIHRKIWLLELEKID